MNEKINLSKILKDCPKGTKLYSTIFGEVEFDQIHNGNRTIEYKTSTGRIFDVTYEGKAFENYGGECTLFPSKDQRDWSKFTVPSYKKEKFDPKTLKPFDKVIVKDLAHYKWSCDLFSYIDESTNFPYKCMTTSYQCCIPYNDETKDLIGTIDQAPEYYRYWED